MLSGISQVRIDLQWWTTLKFFCAVVSIGRTITSGCLSLPGEKMGSGNSAAVAIMHAHVHWLLKYKPRPLAHAGLHSARAARTAGIARQPDKQKQCRIDPPRAQNLAAATAITRKRMQSYLRGCLSQRKVKKKSFSGEFATKVATIIHYMYWYDHRYMRLNLRVVWPCVCTTGSKNISWFSPAGLSFGTLHLSWWNLAGLGLRSCLSSLPTQSSLPYRLQSMWWPKQVSLIVLAKSTAAHCLSC